MFQLLPLMFWRIEQPPVVGVPSNPDLHSALTGIRAVPIPRTDRTCLDHCEDLFISQVVRIGLNSEIMDMHTPLWCGEYKNYKPFR